MELGQNPTFILKQLCHKTRPEKRTILLSTAKHQGEQISASFSPAKPQQWVYLDIENLSNRTSPAGTSELLVRSDSTKI